MYRLKIYTLSVKQLFSTLFNYTYVKNLHDALKFFLRNIIWNIEKRLNTCIYINTHVVSRHYQDIRHKEPYQFIKMKTAWI